MNKRPLSNFQNHFPQLVHKMAAVTKQRLGDRGSLFRDLLALFFSKFCFYSHNKANSWRSKVSLSA